MLMNCHRPPFVAGLEFAKQSIKDSVINPVSRTHTIPASKGQMKDRTIFCSRCFDRISTPASGTLLAVSSSLGHQVTQLLKLFSRGLLPILLECIGLGTGKTLIGKAIASQCGATFFSISASSITSKWTGEAEKMVCSIT